MLLYHSEIESRESGVGSRKGKLQSLKQKRLVQDEDEGVCFAVPPQFAIFSALGCRQSSTYAVTGMPVTFYSSSEMRGAVISSSNDPGDFSGDFLRRLPPYISFSISLRPLTTPGEIISQIIQRDGRIVKKRRTIQRQNPLITPLHRLYLKIVTDSSG